MVCVMLDTEAQRNEETTLNTFIPSDSDRFEPEEAFRRSRWPGPGWGGTYGLMHNPVAYRPLPSLVVG